MHYCAKASQPLLEEWQGRGIWESLIPPAIWPSLQTVPGSKGHRVPACWFPFKPSTFFFFMASLCGCGILVPWPGIEPRSSAVKAQGSNHWTVRKVPKPATSDCQITSHQHSELSWNKWIFWTSLERERSSRRLRVLCSCPHHLFIYITMPHCALPHTKWCWTQQPPRLGSKGKHRFPHPHGVRAGLERGIVAAGPQTRELGPAGGR